MKTTKEIFDEYTKFCYAGVEYNKNDLIKCKSHQNKKWYSEEEIKEKLDELSDVIGKATFVNGAGKIYFKLAEIINELFKQMR